MKLCQKDLYLIAENIISRTETEYLVFHAEFSQVRGGSGVKTRSTKIIADDTRRYFGCLKHDAIAPLFTSHAIFEENDKVCLAVMFQERALIKLDLKLYHELSSQK